MRRVGRRAQVLLAMDHALTRDALASALDLAHEVTAASIAEARARVEAGERPDVAVVDLDARDGAALVGDLPLALRDRVVAIASGPVSRGLDVPLLDKPVDPARLAMVVRAIQLAHAGHDVGAA